MEPSDLLVPDATLRDWVEYGTLMRDEVERLRAELRAIMTYASGGPHQALGEACGIDACTGCLIYATAVAALNGNPA